MFPSMTSRELVAVLRRPPLAYRTVRQRGSHRRLESTNGYPPLTFAWHDRVTIPRGLVRKVLVQDVGLSINEAREVLKLPREAT